jgi:hypothetical protein
MSDPRYQPGIVQGVLLSQLPGEWPATVPGLGPVTFGLFNLCADCRESLPRRDPQSALNGGYATYGGRPLCRFHAQKRAAAAA